MNKTDYMNRLKAEMSGFPGQIIEETLWAYEAKFVDGIKQGATEEQICSNLPSPMAVVEQLRKQHEIQQLKNKFSPSNILRFIFTLFGLFILNSFMLIPLVIFSILNFASYLTSVAIYAVGIFMAAISLSGISTLDMEVSLPAQQLRMEKYEKTYSPKPILVRVTPYGLISIQAQSKDFVQVGERTVAVKHIQVRNEMTQAQTWIGALAILAGIAFTLISLMLTRFGFMLLKPYARWNLNCLLGRLATSAKN
jgi:uncharacterized membrane protein